MECADKRANSSSDVGVVRRLEEKGENGASEEGNNSSRDIAAAEGLRGVERCGSSGMLRRRTEARLGEIWRCRGGREEKEVAVDGWNLGGAV